MYLEDDFKPIFLKQWSLPYKIKDQVGLELYRLVKESLLTPVETCEFGTPIVSVLKANGTICVYEDFKIKIKPLFKNRYLRIHFHK